MWHSAPTIRLLWAVFWGNFMDPVRTQVWDLLVDCILECWPAISEHKQTPGRGSTPEHKVWSVALYVFKGDSTKVECGLAGQFRNVLRERKKRQRMRMHIHMLVYQFLVGIGRFIEVKDEGNKSCTWRYRQKPFVPTSFPISSPHFPG